MTQDKKDFVDNFVKAKNETFEEQINVLLEKLNALLEEFFTGILEKLPSVSIKLNLVGDYSLGSNYQNIEPINIMIEYFVPSEDYQYGEKFEKKGEIGKLLQNSFNFNGTQNVPTSETILQSLYNYLALKSINFKVFKRKNAIYLKFFDQIFVLFIVKKEVASKSSNFQLKGINYNFNLEKLNEKLLSKNEETGGKFFDLVKMYKVIENELKLSKNLLVNANRVLYLYENLLYNLPKEIFCNKVVDSLINSLVFIKNTNRENLIDAEGRNLVNDEYKLFAKSSCTNIDLDKIIKQTEFFIKNINGILVM